MKIVLLGAPGSGKGTQAGLITKRYGIPHISTGDIFRENIREKTPLGIKVKEIIDGGNLCPDDLTVALVKDRLSKPDCESGWLLDGFPRNLFQAKALKEINEPDVVIDLEASNEIIQKRIAGRKSCLKCGGTYNVRYIGDAKACPDCGADLVVRKDDNPESLAIRLQVYHEQTEPLIEYYKGEEKLLSIPEGEFEEVFEQIVKALG